MKGGRWRYLLLAPLFVALLGATNPGCGTTASSGSSPITAFSATHRTPEQKQLARDAVNMAIGLTRDGCPYVYGGTGPCQSGYDCSGLLYKIFLDLGHPIPRVSQDQAGLTPDKGNKIGDLVVFPGAGPPHDHIGIVIDPGQDLMVDAWGVGTVVRIEHYGPSATPGLGLSNPDGFVDPTQ